LRNDKRQSRSRGRELFQRRKLAECLRDNDEAVEIKREWAVATWIQCQDQAAPKT
jgi:hypothetical protein